MKRIIIVLLSLIIMLTGTVLLSGCIEIDTSGTITGTTSGTTGGSGSSTELTWRYTLLDDGTYEIDSVSNATATIEIPSQFNDVAVTRIGYGAFKNNTVIVDVTLPDSITSIGASGYEGCTSLVSIDMGSSVEYVGGAAFSGCSALTTVTMSDSVETLGFRAFEDCTSLASITIPASMQFIGTYAFQDCTKLAAVVFDNLEDWSVGEDAMEVYNTTTNAYNLVHAYVSYTWYQPIE